MNTVFNNNSIQDLQNVIKQIKLLDKRVFLLYGDVGSGKTTFVKYFLEDEYVTSPTFNLCNTYENAFHFDLYMWKKQDIGLLHALTTDKLIFIEWPQFPIKNAVELKFEPGFIIQLSPPK